MAGTGWHTIPIMIVGTNFEWILKIDSEILAPHFTAILDDSRASYYGLLNSFTGAA